LPDGAAPRIDARTLALTAAALTAFAANSLLCRVALGAGSIDAASFTSVRIVSGALMLGLVLLLRSPGRRDAEPGRGWLGPVMLFLYAIAFSYAYLELTAGTGALILFACVQITMLTAGIRGGEHVRGAQWLGMACAFAGLAYLVFPGVTAPPPAGALAMALAGVAWGVYSLAGRGVSNPLAATERNFRLAVPLALAVSAIWYAGFHLTPRGATLAATSGALASGLGYVVWYAALPGLGATRAAFVQLSVPVLAAVAGVLLLSEPVTWRLVLSGVAILGGIALAVRAK
jgi:drug/metabolite transporter (DMT)-like permease